MNRLLDETAGDPLQLGPDDAGRCLSLADYERAHFAEGSVYEVIDGFLIVSPSPTPSHFFWTCVVQRRLMDYAKRHTRIIEMVGGGAEIPIPHRSGLTRPIPDLAAYGKFRVSSRTRWTALCPVIVVEVVSKRRAWKDTVRNRALYWLATGIKEYWIVDPRTNDLAPSLHTLARIPGHDDWTEVTVPFGRTFKSKALPGFSLNLRSASQSR